MTQIHIKKIGKVKNKIPSGKILATFKVETRLLMSLSMPSATPGYCIFMATDRPSCSVAKWTWPMEAAAKGCSSNVATLERQSSPSCPFMAS